MSAAAQLPSFKQTDTKPSGIPISNASAPPVSPDITTNAAPLDSAFLRPFGEAELSALRDRVAVSSALASQLLEAQAPRCPVSARIWDRDHPPSAW